MQPTIKEFQQTIINVVLHDQNPLPFETLPQASAQDIKAVSIKAENWFLSLIGQTITALSLHGFNGTITITDTDHARDLHCIAQAANYRFDISPEVESEPKTTGLCYIEPIINKPLKPIQTMLNPDSFTNPCVQADIRVLLNSIDSYGENDAFGNMRIDLLATCFNELLGSGLFAGMDGERRKDLFDQYQMLCLTLEDLSEFTHKHPDGIKFETQAV